MFHVPKAPRGDGTGSNQRCAWTGFWIFWILTPAASNRIRSEIFSGAAGSGLYFVFVEKTLLVVCLAYIQLDSNRNPIAFISLVPVSSEVSDLVVFVSYFTSQSKGINLGFYFW